MEARERGRERAAVSSLRQVALVLPCVRQAVRDERSLDRCRRSAAWALRPCCRVYDRLLGVERERAPERCKRPPARAAGGRAAGEPCLLLSFLGVCFCLLDILWM